MAFSDFTYPQVRHDLGLTVAETDLFSSAIPATVRPEFQAYLDFGAAIGLGGNTEKARSEFIIAPVFVELRRLVGDRLGVFSGVTVDADPAHGLNGVCDFLLTTSGRQTEVVGPLVAVVEAKNDNVFNGLGQCVAATVAARIINEREGQPNRVVYGVSTTGIAWRFLRLAGTTVTIDRREYNIGEVGRILGAFQAMIQGA